jgi:hypothetical protein
MPRGKKQDFCTSEVQKYKEVQRSTKKYGRSTEEVPFFFLIFSRKQNIFVLFLRLKLLTYSHKSIVKYREVQRSTKKYREVHEVQKSAFPPLMYAPL